MHSLSPGGFWTFTPPVLSPETMFFKGTGRQRVDGRGFETKIKPHQKTSVQDLTVHLLDLFLLKFGYASFEVVYLSQISSLHFLSSHNVALACFKCNHSSLHGNVIL